MLLSALLQATPASAAIWDVFPTKERAIEITEWAPETGDSFLVDRDSNVGYLLHKKGGFTSFTLATGQRRVVRYIGRTYNATTPLASWKALSREIKGDRITFGKSGRFLRLSMEEESGLERTPYGIHSHAYIQAMLQANDRYRSMGCILVADEVLDIIIETFERNGNTLDVQTVAGLGDDSISFQMLQEKMNTL